MPAPEPNTPTAVVAAARSQLTPLLKAVLDSCEDHRALTFFSLLAIQLHDAQEDGDLLDFFLQLSTTAFQGFLFTAEDDAVIDRLLATAEAIAHALSAGESGEAMH